jgi:Spy/CpxP family protein refolding chaperone
MSTHRGSVGRRTVRWALLAILATLTLSAPLAAQRAPDSRRGGMSREELEQRFRAQMARLVQERLGLDARQAEALGEVMQSFEGRRRELGRAEFQTRREVEALVEEGRGSDARARTLLDRLVELRAQESALFAEEQAALLEVLTPLQVLQLHEIRSDLGRRIRALRSRGDDGARRRRGGGGTGFATAPGALGSIPKASRWAPTTARPGIGQDVRGAPEARWHDPGGNVDALRGVGLSL